MKLWFIERTGYCDYNEFDEKVVAATDEEQARYFASLDTGDEGREAWLDPSKSDIREIGTALDEQFQGVVCASFNAG